MGRGQDADATVGAAVALLVKRPDLAGIGCVGTVLDSWARWSA